jgi:hypothetical protein
MTPGLPNRPVRTLQVLCDSCGRGLVLHVTDEDGPPQIWTWNCPVCRAENVWQSGSRLVSVTIRTSSAPR